MSKSFTDAWGFSKLDTYRDCPKKFFFQFIQKLPQPSSPAMERGSNMHEAIEMYLNGWAKTLPENLTEWVVPLDVLKTKDFQAEQALGFDKNWTPLKDWFQSGVWLRAKMDAKYIQDGMLTVIDFKSGKYRVPSTEQVELYAIAGSALHPEVEKVKAEFWFLDSGDIYTRDYTKPELLQLRKKYENYVAPIYADTVWEATPSSACRWCTYSKTKGGPCKF